MLTVFLVSLNSILIIVTIIGIGTFLGRKKLFSLSFSHDISELVVDVALPISIFASTQKYVTRSNFPLLALETGIIMIAILICFAIAIIISKALRIPLAQKGIFINGFVNSNTLFVGLPLNLALFGNSSLPYFLAYFIANTIATWGIGVRFIKNTQYSKNKSKKPNSILSLFTPPMWGFIIGLLFFIFKISMPAFLKESFNYLANLVTPLSLIFLGLQISNMNLSILKVRKLDVLAQFGKFIVSPLVMLLIILIFQRFYKFPGLLIKTVIIQAATPMLTLLPMLAEKAKVDVDFATRILSQSILVFPLVIIVIRVLLG